ncbi:MAG: prohibitin family protein [Chloroflexi bacterium]|nr:prohibitin family protein [Chloroflexota bacterium]
MSGANVVNVLAAIFWGVALLYGGYYLYQRFGKGLEVVISVRWMTALLVGAVGFSLLGVVLTGLEVVAPADQPAVPTLRGAPTLPTVPTLDLGSLLLPIVLFGGVLFFVGLLVQRLRAGQRVRWAIGGLVLFLLLIGGLHALASSLVVIGSTEVGVIFSAFSGTRATPLPPGMQMIIPYADTVYRYSVQQRTYTFSNSGDQYTGGTGENELNVVTSDGLIVGIDCAVRYAIDPAQVVQVHQSFRDTYPQNLVYPTVRAAVANHVAQHTRTEVYGAQRTQIQADIEADIQATLEYAGLQLFSFAIRNVRLPDEYAASLESTQIAKQEAARMQYVLEKEQKDIERKKAAAQGDKDAAVIRAEGEAASLKLISDVLRANQDLLMYRYIEKLTPQVQVIMVPSNSPFILDPKGFLAPVISPTTTATSTLGANSTPTPANE